MVIRIVAGRDQIELNGDEQNHDNGIAKIVCGFIVAFSTSTYLIIYTRYMWRTQKMVTNKLIYPYYRQTQCK